MFKVVLTLILFSYLLFGDKGKEIFKKKCESCHVSYISNRLLRENFMEYNNTKLKLKAPTLNMISFRLKEVIGNRDFDADMHKFEVVEFIKSYVKKPDQTKSKCIKKVLEVFHTMHSMKGKISDEELQKVAEYIYNYEAKEQKQKGDNNFYVSVLSSDGMSKIVGANKDLYKKLESKIQSAIKTALPNATLIKPEYSPIATDKKLISKFESEVDDDEADDNKDELEMVFESGLKPIGFIKAGQLSFDFDLDEAKNSDFAFYDTFSMCKLKVIYNIAQTRPEAGAFAPCTLIIFHKNKTNKTTIAFPNVYNWISTLSLKDKKLVEILTKAQNDIEKLIKSTLE